RSIVADKDYGAPLIGDLGHFAEALLLKCRVAHGQHLVYQQNLWLKVRSYSKSQPYIHTAAVAFDRRVQKTLQLGKGNNLVKLAFDLAARHSQDRAIQVNIVTPSQFRMEA